MNGGIMHSSLGLVGASVLVLAACQAKPAPFNPDDPVAIAQIDSVMQPAFDAARRADADKVLAMAEGPGEFTFIAGDVLLSGVAPIRESFRNTYAGLTRQEQEIITRRIRLLTPDVALWTAVGEGTYTDKAGWTSPPVGLGLTVVLVKQAGRWQALHAHQSVAF